MISPRAFLLPILPALVIVVGTAPAVFAEGRLMTVSLTSDGDAEAAPPKVRWSARPVRKDAEGLWVYDAERKTHAGMEREGLDAEMELPEGAWEVQAVGDNGSHGRVVLEVNDGLAGRTWAVTDSGEPYPPEGKPTQWFLSADTEGPVLTGAPPVADASGFRLETTGEEFRAGESRWITLIFSIPEGFQGTVEFRDVNDLKGAPLQSVRAETLAAERAPMLTAPTTPGHYEIRVVDLQRRALVRHIVHVK